MAAPRARPVKSATAPVSLCQERTARGNVPRMTQDALPRSLETDTLPVEALRAAVPQAEALAPFVLALTARKPDAPMLLLDEQRLLHRGLHVLAAARHMAGFRALLPMLSWPYEPAALALGPHWPAEAPGLLLGLFDGDAAPLFALAGNAGAPDTARGIALLVLARLVWEARAPRAALLDLLDRIDRADPAPSDSLVWLGWQDAIRLLGLTEWQDRVATGWQAGRLPGFGAADQGVWIEKLRAAAAHPGDDSRFAFDGAAPVADPAAALQRWSYLPPPEGQPVPADPLPADARHWLEAFLWQGPLPGKTMSLEEADGFLTALAAGPASLPPAQAVRRVLGATPAHPPHFPTPEHGALTEALLARHFAAIGARLASGLPPVPHLVTVSEPEGDVVGGLWSQGFARGAGVEPAAWRRVLTDPRARAAFNLITGLIPPQGTPRPPAASLSGIVARRLAAIARVPAAVRAIADTAQAIPLTNSLPSVPTTPSLVGRNAACPCGSGRKFKHCCGALGARA